MEIIISKNKNELGAVAAAKGIELINQAIAKNGRANIIVATGASQFEMLEKLVEAPIDWSVVSCFHLDEYIGMSVSHPASFRKYLKERFVDIVEPREFFYISGELDVELECQRLGELIADRPIDVAFVGVGENAHLAFNDPPADFETKRAYLNVKLDAPCRAQQMGEGWFATVEDVPERAISMSVSQIMKSESIICTVPDKRKSKAIEAVVNGMITPETPASILQQHTDTYLFLDEGSASLLIPQVQ